MTNSVCRMCYGTSLFKFLDLGFTPPADQFRRKDQLQEPEAWYPLQVNMCETCGLAQLSYVVSPEILYRNDYPYESSTTKTGREHWARFAGRVVERLRLSKEDLVVDVGSNVGVLLGAFRDLGVKIQGVDPAANIVLLAQKNGIDTICDFFNTESVDKILAEKGRASVITATNCFAHIDNVHEMVGQVSRLLKDDGCFVFEAPYLVNLFKKCEYDTIYHEHLSYLSVKPLIPFFKKFGMTVFDIEQSDIHGGSFRVYAAKNYSGEIAPVVQEMLQQEEAAGIFKRDYLNTFALSVAQNRRDLQWLLQSLKHQGKKIVAVSAPAKGMTLLNYCRLGNEVLDFVTEKSKLKIGRVTPGAHIPVVSDDQLLSEKPDYALLLAWNFADEIIKNLDQYRKGGGKFIIPVPTPRILE